MNSTQLRTIDHTPWHLGDPDVGLRKRQRRLALLLGMSTTLATLAIVLWWLTTRLPSSCQDYCSCEPAPRPNHSIEILLDQSDPFTPAQRQAAKTLITEYVEQLGVGDHVSVMVLTPNKQNHLTEIISACRPPQGKDVSIWSDAPQKREKAYREEFLAPIMSALVSSLEPHQGNSPLIEVLWTIAQRSAFKNGGSGRTLIYLGDGLQNSEIANFFSGGYSFKKIGKRKLLYLSGLRQRFEGACIQWTIVNNKHHTHTKRPEYLDFWTAYWSTAGVNPNCLHFERI